LINIHQRAPINQGNTLRAGTIDIFQAYEAVSPNTTLIGWLPWCDW
jgi:hypothetical protein